ncbi:MAG: tRNA (adenosine(37)-N6)-threonylcarbamoyltransferase complex dimerization subunit type 1 TsaB [Lachnospiraceae bacterium]|nr:tRNA (adenosine(37)-N6)-threonylcarbamoyltransferase complex dimerization subunit type 1 TsaB [Lachnospiraceae bacterium]
MKVLGIESSGQVAAVSIVEDNRLVGDYTINHKKTHSQTLLPMLEELKKLTELDLDTIDCVAISKGPGSFTGLRIGSGTAKGLCMGLQKPLVEVSTLQAMAYNFWGRDELICPIMDARRNQVYTGLFSFNKTEDDYELEIILEDCAVCIEEVIQKINEIGRPVVFLGDGIFVFENVIRDQIKVPVSFAPASFNEQRASSVAVLGEKLFKEGKAIDAAMHAPEYLRLSQAERERNERQLEKGKE